MLTEKECRQALEILKARVNYENVDAIICFKELIDEHFDNPPLKFEELEVGKPYWDNLKECWFIATEYDPTSYYKYKEINWYLDKNDACYLENIYENEFDENRYYRKQVEE